MSTSRAENYGRRARDASDHKAVGDAVKRAVDELVEEIETLKRQVADLESRVR